MLTEGSEGMYARSAVVTVVSSGVLSFYSALYITPFFFISCAIGHAIHFGGRNCRATTCTEYITT